MTGSGARSSLFMHEEDVFPPLEELVAAWTGGIADATEEAGGAIYVTDLGVELPVEFQLVTDGDALRLHASPPTQKIETTVLPVWHALRVRYVLEG